MDWYKRTWAKGLMSTQLTRPVLRFNKSSYATGFMDLGAGKNSNFDFF